MRWDVPGKWEGRDVFQLRPPEFFVESGLVGEAMPTVNALGETSGAYIAVRRLVELRDGAPVCEGQPAGRDVAPFVLLPDRAALSQWCTYAARFRGEAYERAWEGDARRRSGGSGWSFLMGARRRNLHCDYFCTYLDELGVCVAFEPCSFDGKHYFTGYYSYGQATVIQRWKNRTGARHVIVRRGDVAAIGEVVDVLYGWYDGGARSVTAENMWHEGTPSA